MSTYCKSLLKIRHLCSSLKPNSIRNISIYASNKSKSSDKFEETDWFKKLTTDQSASKHESDSKPQTNTASNFSSNMINRKKFQDLSIEKKREIIQNLWNFRKENGLPAPKELNEQNMLELLKCESFTHLTNSMIHQVKEEFYDYQKAQKRLDREKREKIVLDDGEDRSEVITNYPGKDTYLKRVNTSEIKRFNRSKVLSSVLNNEPSIVFDLQFTNMHTRIEHVKSLYRQYIEIISLNRSSPEPFQIHLCNYDYNSEFHQKYGQFLELDLNLIFETPKSYMDIFPKEKLVYLSKEAKTKMSHYDPEKVYIIGSMIDMGDDKFKYYSYSQAKKDGLRCERLPLDDHVKWTKGQKSLNMDHMFNIFLKIKSGMSWKDAFTRSLPKRKLDEFLHGSGEFRKRN